MDYLITNKSKNPLLNFYKAKLKKKDIINKSNNIIFNNGSNQKNLKTFRKESKDKNKAGSIKYKTSKNSPNSSLIRFSNRIGQIDSKESVKKKEMKYNKVSNSHISGSKNKIKYDLFEEFFMKKLKKIYKKNTNGQISQRQKSTKNIFSNFKNDSTLNSSNLTKNKKTMYGNSNIYISNSKIKNKINNNTSSTNIIEEPKIKSKRENSSISKSGLNSINNSSLIPSSTSYRKIIKDNNKINNKAYYNNFLNKQKEKNNNNNNNTSNEKGYIGNYNLMKHIENKYDNNNIDESLLKKYNININKNKIFDNNTSSNSKIKKVNAVDYLYNTKYKNDSSKYAIKHLDENYYNHNISGLNINVSKKIKNKENIASFEINGSYAENIEINNLNNTSLALPKKNNKSDINKKRVNTNEKKSIKTKKTYGIKNEEIIRVNSNNSNNNLYDLINSIKYRQQNNNISTHISNSNNFMSKKKLSKENINNYLNHHQMHKSNILNIKGLSGFSNNKSSQSGNYLIKSSHLSSNNINDKKIQDINSKLNNEDNNNNTSLNISSNNNFSNINNQNSKTNTDNKNNAKDNFINNNYIDIDINNYNKNISKNEKEPNNNELIYQKKIPMMQKDFTSYKNSNYNSINNDNKNYNNFNVYNHYNENSNNQGNIIKAKLIKNLVQINNFISPNKNSETSGNNNLSTNNIKKYNDFQEKLFRSKDKDKNNISKDKKNKNIILDNEVYDINLNEINDFSPIYDEKKINDNIQDKINKQNQQLHIHKNNISLINSKHIKINDDKSNKKIIVNYNYKSKVNTNNKDEEKSVKYHKYSQSQSLGKKVKELNKKIIDDISNVNNTIKIKNNLLLENKYLLENSNSKMKVETNSIVEEFSNNNILNYKKLKDKNIKNLIDLIDSKENSEEVPENKEKEKEKENVKKKGKSSIFNKKEDIVSLKINNLKEDGIKSLNNSKEIKKVNSKELEEINDMGEMLCVPDSPQMRKKEDNIILTTISKDCDYYKDEMEKLANYIKNYYDVNGKYPESRIEFYLYGRQIGHGAFGKVNLALHVASGRLVAIKTFSKKHLKNKHAKQKIKHEINILSHLRHPFINQILDSFETDKHIFIVMEYVCGDLLDFIRKRGKLSESISKLIFKQIIEGLRYIHKKKIVHRDIKLDNILIDLTNTVKICDFGVSRKLSNGDIMYEHCGTPAYIAPEIFQNKGYEGYLCDIWSAGVTLYYMLSGSQPFRANSIKELEKIVIQGKFEEIEEVSKEANDLINEMLQVDPKKRINIDKILKHPWLKNVDLENRKNLNLFTESEKILLSKFDVDYLTSQKEELIENFSIKNLETNNNEANLQNGDTKSLIFAPYNSYIEEPRANLVFEEDKIYEELEILNEACKFGWKVQQANIKYELSNNNDFDNGVIKTQKEEDIKNQNEKIEKKYEEKILNDRLSGLNTPRVRSANDSFEESEKIIVKKEIIKRIEKEVGYDRKYIINCIRKNKINYATATYYLLARENIL